MDLNTSGMQWEILNDRTLVAPLTSIKGLGEKAIEQIIANRPFNTIEEFLFNENIVYSKLNKKAIDVLCRSGTMSALIDDRFSGDKHFWSAVCIDRPRNIKKLIENIETYRPEGSFTEEETIEFITDLTGMFPFSLVMTPDVKRRLSELYVPPISEYDRELGVTWLIPRKIIKKTTRTGKAYYLVEAIDSNSVLTKVRCWGVNPVKDSVHRNRPYMIRPSYSLDWGFSTRGPINKTWKLLG